ncbi:hypothetical protein NEIELOOT_01295 [Neisseria elongata subsp. glycolytica ATCC 29315]|uniref:Uncharacterized protein n=1 Tax=Neisseria elongata subsp. glycolytica ATCC 29315 TaxID=546263 RepID=D4DQF7_NEIEG|nr:hypothetical protein NEIELOOT_01295 [Neisseria elongata subsp. glycolytica ATCC 29315]
MPLFGVNHAHAAGLAQPVDFDLAAEEDAAQDQPAHAFGMGFGVGQREGAAPRAAEYQPAFDAQHFAYFFNVGHQIPSRVLAGFGVGQGTAAAALVDDDDAVFFGVEKSAAGRRCARARAAVQEDDGDAVGVAAFFPVDLMDGGYLQQAAADGFSNRMHGFLLVVGRPSERWFSDSLRLIQADFDVVDQAGRTQSGGSQYD